MVNCQDGCAGVVAGDSAGGPKAVAPAHKAVPEELCYGAVSMFCS